MNSKNKVVKFLEEKVLPQYALSGKLLNIEPWGTGLINSTWKITTGVGLYILQKVNNIIFKQPKDIERNISLIAQYLNQYFPEYLFAAPIKTVDYQEMIFIEGEGYFRLFPFITGTHTCTVVRTAEMAFEAAAQFGRFTKLLSGFNQSKLIETIPDFHNLTLRYNQFIKSIETAEAGRKEEAGEWIEKLKQHYNIVSEFLKLTQNPEFKKRVTHHDTKISNVLFNNEEKGVCVIDLDTIMPGYFISDVGDMMRTYLCAVSEEERDFKRISVRKEFFTAILEGYLSEMGSELSATEKELFFYSGKFSIYMQALRFLTDYLNNDVYYSEAYPGQNITRAINQIVLLENYISELGSDSNF